MNPAMAIIISGIAAPVHGARLLNPTKRVIVIITPMIKAMIPSIRVDEIRMNAIARIIVQMKRVKKKPSAAIAWEKRRAS